MSNIVHITRGDLKNSENNPNGSVTPDYVGQKCLSTKGNLYMAKGTTNTSWVPVHDETGVIKVQGVTNPGIVIQQTTNTQNTEGRIIFTNADNSQSTRIRFNHFDGVRAPYGVHIEKDTVSSDQSSLKAYLDVEGDIYSNGNKVYHAGNKPSAATIGAVASKGDYGFGGNQNNITTANFITLLESAGAFNSHHWTSKGTWSYASNQIITDTGCGNIHLAGSTVEKIGPKSAYTIRILTPNTGSGTNRAEFVYINHGDSYSPGWRRVLSVSNVANQNGSFDNTTTAPTGTTRLNYSGYFYATRSYNAVWNDYAEYFMKENQDDVIEVGDIVMISDNSDKYVKADGKYTTKVVGVVSDSYGHILGGVGDHEIDEKENVAVGLAGRIDVKIIGKISKGDLIANSEIPGVGMKADKYIPGSIVGKAIENKEDDGIGKVKMLILNC